MPIRTLRRLGHCGPDDVGVQGLHSRGGTTAGRTSPGHRSVIGTLHHGSSRRVLRRPAWVRRGSPTIDLMGVSR